MTYFLWWLLNVGVPILGPILILAPVAISHGKPIAKQMIFESVKDGQLFWSAIALSAAAIFELTTALGIERTSLQTEAASASGLAGQGASIASAALSNNSVQMPSVYLIEPTTILGLSIIFFSLIAFFSSLLVMLATLKAYNDRALVAAVAAATPPVNPPVGVGAGGAGEKAALAEGADANAANSDVPVRVPLTATVKVSIGLAAVVAVVFGIVHGYLS